ncbi:hypothetical protein EJ05DRAFT_475116 [Pseudovirgaria hyperparasitica]|uniref:Uncharacterized protein n=1 Tax=Pseudovirgaria hyperparasitica TaxID=470096 RepID=A0A6A6WCM8_9PEZI|nr:uncharacterized protein EJ05DRAFT_475116 [Pseudovirgaria hyperparasitica]KAF2758861.1 hypothetical protein EJ05DRAFT_475116 [Pseudovirgaria hyperparasitica]
MQPTLRRAAGFIYRQNNVPHYQRLFQKNDGVRQWNKVRRDAIRAYTAGVYVDLEANASHPPRATKTTHG